MRNVRHGIATSALPPPRDDSNCACSPLVSLRGERCDEAIPWRTLRFLAFALLFACVPAYAATGADLTPIPEPTSLIVDEVGVLSDSERRALLTRLTAFQEDKRAQIGVLISKGTGGQPLPEYSLRVAEQWQLGRAARDDGLLILIVPSPTAVRLEVGYGLEGYIPDARAAQWVDELFPAVKEGNMWRGLDRLLDRIDGVLPKPQKQSDSNVSELFPGHPEWNLPFVLVVFSLFSLFPMFFGRSGSIVSAPLLATFYGLAAWALWESTRAGAIAAAIVFPLPLLWGLNRHLPHELPRWLAYARTVGNLCGVLMFFSIITLFVGATLRVAEPEYVLAAPVFAGMLSLGLAIVLFPGKPEFYLGVILRSTCHFIFVFVVAYAVLSPFAANAGHLSLVVAAAVTALAALGLYLDSLALTKPALREPIVGLLPSQWFFLLAALVTLPFGVIALIFAVGGEDLQTQIAQGVVGGGSIAGVLALAARLGLITAIKVGLGGAFGGGGAQRSD